MSGLRAHIRGNVIGYVALFAFATSGTASALDGSDTVFSDDIVNSQVKTVDVDNGQIRSADVADDTTAFALTGQDIAANTLTGADVDEASLDSAVLQRRLQSACGAGLAIAAVAADGTTSCVSPGGPPTGTAGGSLSGTYPNPAIASNAIGSANVVDNSLVANDIAADAVGTSEVDASLTGADIADTGGGTLGGADINESTLAKVPDADKLDGQDSAEYSNQAAYVRDQPGCNPNSAAFINCAATGITLPSASNVLVIATAAFEGTGVGNDRGVCELRRDNASVSGGFSQGLGIGQAGNEHDIFGDGFGRSAVDVNVPAGPHTWSLACQESDGDLKIFGSQLVVMRLSG